MSGWRRYRAPGGLSNRFEPWQWKSRRPLLRLFFFLDPSDRAGFQNQDLILMGVQNRYALNIQLTDMAL